MIASFKALVYVLAIATLVFWLAKPIALRFTSNLDFLRRRNVWLALTFVAFLSPNFWLFVLVATPVLVWAGRKDTNPIAFYLLLLHVVPDIPINISIIGINALFQLNNYRLLSICVLIPTAWRVKRSNTAADSRGLTSMDYLLLAFGALQILVYVPPNMLNQVPFPDSPTNVLRRAFLFFVDTYILYYVVSRTCSSRSAILDAMATFYLTSVVMALVSVFESLRHWLLYADIIVRWGQNLVNGYSYTRGGSVRAQASAGHALALGYLLAIAFGFWLYLQSRLKSAWMRIVGAIVLWLGLVASYSRGPWIGAAAAYMAFAALGPSALSRLFKATVIVTLLVGALSLTPAGEKLINTVPFLGGTADDSTVAYRHRLAERSWELILENPLLGDGSVLFKMEDLRQGEGIIDVVNTYAEMALFYGLVGLSLFVSFIMIALLKMYGVAKKAALSDPDVGRLGMALVATILGVLLMLENSSFIQGLPIMFYVLAGLAAAYIRLDKAKQPAMRPPALPTIRAR
jgi:O-antigen ligase